MGQYCSIFDVITGITNIDMSIEGFGQESVENVLNRLEGPARELLEEMAAVRNAAESWPTKKKKEFWQALRDKSVQETKPFGYRILYAVILDVARHLDFKEE